MKGFLSSYYIIGLLVHSLAVEFLLAKIKYFDVKELISDIMHVQNNFVN